MDKNIEISIKSKIKHMFEFQMRHYYMSMQGMIAVLFSLGAFVYYLISRSGNDMMTNYFLIFASLLFTVIYPFHMWQRSMQLVKLSPVLSRPLNYTFTSEGILIAQDDDDVLFPWEDIKKVVETRNLLLVYSSPKNGYILPKAQYKEQYASIKTMIKREVDDEVCKLKLRGE